MIFSEILEDLQKEVKTNFAQIQFLLKKNPVMAYPRIVEIGKQVGRKYDLKLILNFPGKGKIENFDMYGKQDLSLIMDDLEKKRFPIKREIIKEKAKEIFGDIEVEDSYMREGKEGVRVFYQGSKIDILPHSIHIWTVIDQKIIDYCNWLMENVFTTRTVKL